MLTPQKKRKLHDLNDEEPAKFSKKQPSYKPISTFNTFTRINGCLKLIKTVDLGLQKTSRKPYRQNLKKVTNLPNVSPDSDTSQPETSSAQKFEEGKRKRKETKEGDATGKRKDRKKRKEEKASSSPPCPSQRKEQEESKHHLARSGPSQPKF